jgi:hypothetical protein
MRSTVAAAAANPAAIRSWPGWPNTTPVGPRLSGGQLRADPERPVRRGRRMHRHACLTADVCAAVALGMHRDVLVMKRRSAMGVLPASRGL